MLTKLVFYRERKVRANLNPRDFQFGSSLRKKNIDYVTSKNGGGVVKIGRDSFIKSPFRIERSTQSTIIHGDTHGATLMSNNDLGGL